MRSLCPLALLAACTFPSPEVAPDAGADTPSGDGGEPRWVEVEQMMIPVHSPAGPAASVTSKRTLEAGVGYRLRASGTFFIALQTLADAEYYNFNNTTGIRDAESGIDVGLAVNDATIDANRTPRWGNYSATHMYEVDWMGTGAPIVVQFHDGNYMNNSGMLMLAILAPQ